MPDLYSTVKEVRPTPVRKGAGKGRSSPPWKKHKGKNYEASGLYCFCHTSMSLKTAGNEPVYI